MHKSEVVYLKVCFEWFAAIERQDLKPCIDNCKDEVFFDCV